ncbi:MAG: hypothetical protein IJH65_11135, partial [Methanobrevibacter sp.]|nr:hypothetical protein [Methanobrevibacter sp.]
WLVFGRYGTFGKNMLKILEGCGYALSVSDEFKSILPLVSYYKVWFDLFMPARDKTWKDSAAFSLMELSEQSGNWDMLYDDDFKSRLLAFLDLLPQCYYTQNPDYAAAHIIGNRNSIVAGESLKYLNFNNQMDSVDSLISRSQATPSSGLLESSAAIRMLDILSRRVNVKSVAGGRLDVILRSIYGSDYIDQTESNYIGSTSFDLDISEIMNHAETSEGYLGQYAGAGRMSESGSNFVYKNTGNGSTFGYVISLFCIVPRSNMSQGQDMQVIRRTVSDFYARDVDSSTLVPTPKANIFGESDYGGFVSSVNFDKVYDSGFGNIPVYFEYKFKKNVLSGEFRMRSTRDSMLPFTLDKLLPYTDARIVSDSNTTGRIVIHNLSPSLLVAGSNWRYLGLHPWLGQFNRIFVNSGDASAPDVAFDVARYQYYDRIDDNFVVDLYIEYNKTSPALPIADSWQTEAYGEKLRVDLS